MSARSYMAEALSQIATHARHYETVAANSEDRGAQFVYGEIAEMLIGMANLKRSPLLDELNARLSDKDNDDSYYRGRSIATAIAAMLMAVRRVSKAEACRQASAVVEGISYSMLYTTQKSGLYSGFKMADLNTLDNHTRQAIDVHRDIAREKLGRDPSDEETLCALIDNGRTYKEKIVWKDWRSENIKKALRAPVPKNHWRIVQECWSDSLDSMKDARAEAIERRLKP